MTAPMNVTIDNIIEWFWFEENPQHYPSKSKPVEWPAPGLELRMDGVWVQVPDDRSAEFLSPKEFRLLYRNHPFDDLSKPALQLPCTGAELVSFLEWVGDADLYLKDDSGFNPVPLDIRKALLAERAIAKGEPAPKDTREKWEIPEGWEFKARKIGQEWMLSEEKNSGIRPGVTAIGKYVEGELSNQDIRGRRGRYLDASTIQREALTGLTERKPKGKK